MALAVTATALVLGILLGVTAAYAPAPVERAILAVFDIISSFPSLILALALVAVLGPGLINVIILVTIVFVPQFGRVARAQTLTVKERPFLEAERALGASGPRIMLFHVLPNIIGPIVVLACMNIPVVITLEAGLELPRRRHPPAAGELGLDAVRRLHLSRAVDLAGAGGGRHADARDARLHAVRREPARCDRSQAEARAMSDTPLVEIENLSVDFATANGAVHALRDVSLSIGRRRVVGIVGESGSGKSTLALALLGLLPENTGGVSGRIVLDGEDLLALGAGARCGGCAARASP